MAFHFEWDPAKAARNRVLHHVSFEEASTIFGDPLEVTIQDPDHSKDEDRWLSLGQSRARRLLLVSYTERGKSLRLISAREASAKERRDYENRG